MQNWHAVALVFGQVLIGATFAASALGKIRDPDGFAQAAAAFRLIPDRRVRLVARLLTMGEVLVVTLLAAGLAPAGGIAVPIGLAVAVALLIAYTVGLIAVRVRGMTVACHCFGASPAAVSWWDVARNGLFLGGAAVGVAGGEAQSGLPFGDAVLVAMVGLAAALIVSNVSNVVTTVVRVAGAE